MFRSLVRRFHFAVDYAADPFMPRASRLRQAILFVRWFRTVSERELAFMYGD